MMKESIAQLHTLYCQLTGMSIALDMNRERSWFEFQRKGFNGADLRGVVREIQKGIKTGKRNVGALRFRNLIESLDYFEEESAMVRAHSRKPVINPGLHQVLKATGRPTDPQQPDVMPAKAVLEGQKMASMLKSWRESNL